MKIYTKKGDDGTTRLHGGKKVMKSDVRVDTYGTVDELNALIGLAIARTENKELHELLTYVNNLLFICGSDIASPLGPEPNYTISRISEHHIIFLEAKIDYMTSQLPELKNFILPGGSELSALLHVCRTVCRRAERLAVMLSQEQSLGIYMIKFLNRLSDFLFTTARYANFISGLEDMKWTVRE